MTIYHDCKIPKVDLPSGIRSASERWMCPICGQIWRVTRYRNGTHHAVHDSSWTWKNIRWQRSQRKLIEKEKTK